MAKEFETRVIDVDKRKILAKLETLGAQLKKDVLQKRLTFDFPDARLDAANAWVRLRDTGDGKVELAYKCLRTTGETGVADCDEVEFGVTDMATAEQFLILIGLERKAYQETKRTRYALGDLTFDLDEWPMIPPFVEIEGPSKERVMEGVRLLGYDTADTFQGDAGAVYEKHGIDWKALKEIRFS